MSDRIVEIAESPAHIRFENELLVLELDGGDRHTIPTREVAAVILSHPRVTLTHGILTGLAAAGVPLICANAERQPVGMFLATHGHSTHTERCRMQASLGKPLLRRIWQQVVRAKVKSQASQLEMVMGTDAGLRRLAGQVRSGDATSVESTAAQRYWAVLFGDAGFIRRRDAPDQNRFLNYGYAVLHAITARNIAGVGLNPALGVHHRNKYNAYCLASDLMEPFRVWVDEAAIELVETHGSDTAMTRAVRSHLIESVMGRRDSGGEARTGPDLIRRAVWSLLAVMQGRQSQLEFPE